ncbi:adenylosuccinate lyase [Aquimarina sp. MMG016]|uniref:adenylosuccinate lyase n=1 Tax=Aquimarina sp. MMG016 TaxID=2822690 RepID=UPI001B39E757|nr:adenylosuccinate lyase [Aquimarina sp. MMG016]MBQ4821739.1 adenylosuccinate lyase [Aquimarina sp. MMG016]
MIHLEEILSSVNHSREKRSHFANLIIQHPELLPELLHICSRVDEEISCRASWGLEFLCKHHLEAILPYLDQLFMLIPKVYQHPAVRPMAKICEYLILAYYEQKKPIIRDSLTIKHREQIAEFCFDWLITDQKVAPKAYSITCLYLLGTDFEWIHPELKTTLENNYHSGSAAYKARSRIILKKLR